MIVTERRACSRPALLAAAAAVTAFLVVPLGVLVRDGWEPLRTADVRVVRSLELRSGSARDGVLVLTQLGAPLLLELTAAGLAVFLLSRRRRRLGSYVLVNLLGAELLSTIAKQVVARVRPCVEAVSGCPRSTSFPSGHAVGAAAFWTAVAVLLLPLAGRLAWTFAVVPPLLVAATRVLLGVHYPSDVIAGLLLGWAWAAASTAVLASSGRATTTST